MTDLEKKYRSFKNIYLSIYLSMCVCVCVCVNTHECICVREKERESNMVDGVWSNKCINKKNMILKNWIVDE